MKSDKHILITGSHRSGSTWVGRILSSSSEFVYVDEPFNIGKDHKNSPFKNQFEYLDGKSPSEQSEARKYLNSFHSLSAGITFSKISKIRSLKQGRRFLSDINSRITRRYIYKDPLALMSAEWIHQTYGWKVVILVRHPAAFVASLKVKDWQFYFHYFLNQPTLINKHLAAYEDDIREYTRDRPDIIKQGILLWNILYTMVLYYKEKYGDQWYFVKHEDLSVKPREEFQKLYEFLDIEFDDGAIGQIEESTSATKNSLLKRDSKQNIKTWKERLTKEEIELIYAETKDVWKHYYTEDDW